jgi:polar amino acid transport system permease protein
MSYQFDFSFLSVYGEQFLDGLLVTIWLSASTLVLGTLLGVICAVARVHGNGWMRRIAGIYVETLRNTPLVVQAFWLFFGMAALGLRVPAFHAAVLVLSINVAAYVAEIVRAGLESIPAGQREAADCLALKRHQRILRVELPQAIEAVYPALVSQFILMMLATSIMSQISVEELTGAAYGVQSETFRGFEIYIVVAVLYLILSWLTRAVFLFAGNIFFPRKRRLAMKR